MNADNQPISIDLAREADFSLGPLNVRPSLRQVEAGGESETLEPRVMQVLVALARRRGEVVSKDDLIQLCWGGRIVGEDAISRVVTRVRKLGDQHAAFSLETIPRVGYRLTASGAEPTEAVRETKPRSALAGFARSRWALPTGAGVALALLAIAVAALSRDPTDVDSVVARLTERLQQQNLSTRDIQRSADVAEALGTSGRPEERSAFAALASGDSLQAISVLEDLAAKLESRGETKAAAEVLTRIGAIALVVDQSRGLRARQKAFELDPASLTAFQGLFFDTTVLKGGVEASAMADEMLRQTNMTPRMRAWILAHTAVVRIDSLNAMQDLQAGEDILLELRRLHEQTGDPVIQATTYWIGSLLAFNRDDLRVARDLAERMVKIWPTLPESPQDSGEVMLIRVLYAQGDRERAFVMAADALDRRSRTGEFLPTPIIMLACEAGAFTGSTQRATPFCSSISSRLGTSFGAEEKAFSGLAAAANGDLDLAEREFAAGHAVAPSGSALPVRLMFFEAWAAMKAGNLDKAGRLVREVNDRTANSADAEGSRSFRAHAWRLLGEGFIANGEPASACAPLLEAGRLYTEIGGDPGRAAVDALRSAARCQR